MSSFHIYVYEISWPDWITYLVAALLLVAALGTGIGIALYYIFGNRR